MGVWRINGKVVAEDGIIDEGINSTLEGAFSGFPSCYTVWPEPKMSQRDIVGSENNRDGYPISPAASD